MQIAKICLWYGSCRNSCTLLHQQAEKINPKKLLSEKIVKNANVATFSTGKCRFDLFHTVVAWLSSTGVKGVSFLDLIPTL